MWGRGGRMIVNAGAAIVLCGCLSVSRSTSASASASARPSSRELSTPLLNDTGPCDQAHCYMHGMYVMLCPAPTRTPGCPRAGDPVQWHQ